MLPGQALQATGQLGRIQMAFFSHSLRLLQKLQFLCLSWQSEFDEEAAIKRNVSHKKHGI